MLVRNLDDDEPFVTATGSTIRELLNVVHPPTRNQSMAELSLAAGRSTRRHYHLDSEQVYFVLGGAGTMEIDGEQRPVEPGDAILIPPGARHTISAHSGNDLRLLSCCAPPFSHEDAYFD